MKINIAHISYTHNEHWQLKWWFDPSNIDIIIHSGDFTNHGTEEEVKNFMGWFYHLPIKHKILVDGNHDKSFDTKLRPTERKEFVDNAGWKGAREKGKVRSEGRDYIMADGDVVEFKIGS